MGRFAHSITKPICSQFTHHQIWVYRNFIATFTPYYGKRQRENLFSRIVRFLQGIFGEHLPLPGKNESAPGKPGNIMEF